jgi:hypothetical protein
VCHANAVYVLRSLGDYPETSAIARNLLSDLPTMVPAPIWLIGVAEPLVDRTPGRRQSLGMNRAFDANPADLNGTERASLLRLLSALDTISLRPVRDRYGAQTVGVTVSGVVESMAESVLESERTETVMIGLAESLRFWQDRAILIAILRPIVARRPIGKVLSDLLE